tara:strand:- start:10468 stop:11649 length:1182 start_codon:yes stop_codon:yes gene_type:complete
MFKEYYKTITIYLLAGASSILITLLVTPHLNNNLDNDNLLIFGKLITYYGIGITLCSLAIPNSIVIFKNNISENDYSKIFLTIPFYFFISTLIYITLIKIINFNLSYYHLLCLFVLIYTTLIFNSINMNYQANLKKWTSFSLTTGYAFLLVISYYFLSLYTNIDLISLRLLIPVVFYFTVILFFYNKLYANLETRNPTLKRHYKKIFFHVLTGVILTQLDRIFALTFFENESIGYILATIYFSPLIMFGIQFNNAFKPFFFKIISNQTMRTKMLLIYSLVTIIVSVVYYFLIDFILNLILNIDNLQYKEYALVVSILFTLLNLYNPFGAILIYLKKEVILSITTSIYAMFSIVIMLGSLMFESFFTSVLCFLFVNGLYLLSVMFISLKKLRCY